MGGISDATIAVECDRCEKKVSVPAGEQTDFYRAFAARDDERQDERMFVATMAVPGVKPPEEEVDDGWRLIEFEYMCPKCIETVNKYMDKIAKSKSEDPGKPEASGKDSEGGKEKDADPRNSEPEKTEEKEPEPEKAAGQGADFDDSELFNDD